MRREIGRCGSASGVPLQSVQTVLTQKSYLIVPGTSAPRERGVGFVASSSNDYEDQSS